MNTALAQRREPVARLKTSFEVVADKPLATMNGRDGMCWRARHGYTKNLRGTGYIQTASWFNLLSRKGLKISKNCRVRIHFTRYGRYVDDDNLRGSFKAVRDGISDAFCEQWETLNKKGRGDDSDKRFSWNYAIAPVRGSVRGLAQIEVIPMIEEMAAIDAGINAAIRDCHNAAVRAGWYTDLETGERKKLNPSERLMLIVSEIAEANEGIRKNCMDDHLPDRRMVEVELADALIRIFDFAGDMGLDLAGAYKAKRLYNEHRKDHKIENRKKKNGKKS